MAARGTCRHPVFDLPHVRPNTGFWTKCSYWTPEEAAALWLDCDPEFLNDGTIAPYLNEPIGKDYTERVFLLRRALESGEFDSHLKPWTVVKWTERLGMPMPTPISDAISNFERRRTPDRGTSKGAVKVPSPANTIDLRYHKTLQKLVAAMAADAYKFDAGKQRQAATSQIASAVERLGLSIDEATVLTHLRNCTAFALDEAGINPNSD